MKITFTDTMGIADIYHPKPSENDIPEWYKKMNSYIDNGKEPPHNSMNSTNATIKKCMPVFDMLTAGYIIYTYVDLFVTEQDGKPYYRWADKNAIEFHNIVQSASHPMSDGLSDTLKWVNPFGISTPKNVSCLFINPTHRDNKLRIFEGIVDTDVFTAPVHFPCVLSDSAFRGLIPAGTPLAQVIPFRREEYTMTIGGEKERLQIAKDNAGVRSKFYDGYKKIFRQKKSFT
jgi:hypothetical protein